MSLPIYQRVAVTDAGDVIPGAEYTVINENTGVAQPIYSDRTGSSLKSAPYFADSAGTIQFFIAQGTTFRVAASGGVGTYTDRYVYGISEAVFVSDNGNVGIGIAAPLAPLAVKGTTDGNLWVRGASAAAVGLTGVGLSSVNDAASAIANMALEASNFHFVTNNTERLRIDSVGNLLVGKTTTSFFTAGTAFRGDNPGLIASAREGVSLELNRLTSDGNIIELAKNGVNVGSIGTFGGVTYYGSSGGGLMFNGLNINPTSGGSSRSDATNDIGAPSFRFKEVYASSGFVNTSDRNEKQDILKITAAETAVAKACKGLLQSFRWIDAVEEKGDDARIHFGIMAQDLQDAFTAENLDAGRYGMFMSNTWWETQTEVAAVESVEEVTDEDGNVTTEAVEAKDAYTRTDTFETLAKAPAGATERTRLGVRYNELLSFIIAAL